mgnify:CR=1 FL=1
MALQTNNQQVKKIVPELRPSFTVCNKTVDMNDPLVQELKDLTSKNTSVENFTSNFYSNNKPFDNYDEELVVKKYKELKLFSKFEPSKLDSNYFFYIVNFYAMMLEDKIK